MIKTYIDLTLNDLEDVIRNCGWMVQRLNENFWKLKIDLSKNEIYSLEIPVSKNAYITYMFILLYLQDYNEEQYIRELMLKRRKYDKLTEEELKVLANDAGVEILRLKYRLPRKIADKLKELNGVLI